MVWLVGGGGAPHADQAAPQESAESERLPSRNASSGNIGCRVGAYTDWMMFIKNMRSGPGL